MNETLSRVKIDIQLKDQGWDLLNTNAVVIEKAEVALLTPLVRAFRSEPGLDAPAEGAAVA